MLDFDRHGFDSARRRCRVGRFAQKAKIRVCVPVILFCVPWCRPSSLNQPPSPFPVLGEFCAAFARPKRSRRARNQCHVISETKRTTPKGTTPYPMPVRVNSLKDSIEVPQWHPSTFKNQHSDILRGTLNSIQSETHYLCGSLERLLIAFVPMEFHNPIQWRVKRGIHLYPWQSLA